MAASERVRFLADENVEAAVVQALRDLGHEVLEVGRLKPAASDDEVVSLARERRCVLVTNDKDFGELVFLQGKRIPGALLLRLPGKSGDEKAPMVRAVVRETGARLLHHFVVVERGRVRSRPLRVR
jgi:predicted nuclease of predicted toxin-antitoxin system